MLGKHSGRLRQAQTTQGEGQASRREQFNPATRRLPRQVITTRLRYAPTDSDVRRDVPAAKHCNSFGFSPCAPPLETIKGRAGLQSEGLDFRTTTREPGTNSLSRPACKPCCEPASTLGSGTRQPRTGCRYYSSEARIGINPVVSRTQHPSPTHDRHKFTAAIKNPDKYNIYIFFARSNAQTRF
jgi:hypothetical protein